ncbi:hypothetical protein [Priestia taiwanensis]|uniref:Uncharacterized protein n=1 Tax=Priestia taiwanensis TaxID=1347902 RepID=A0A917ALG8_9BACI|nr:hypothetical protein [Priestia taiwanensis]GGE57075.1 hypothetical protein GCM10007140_04250 [Priestia taiwanensis]
MSTYTIGIITVCFLSVLFVAYASRRHGTLMEQMVFIMAFSMSIGLSIGFYVGVLLKGDLLYSALLAIAGSGLIGFLIGICFHLYTGLEGLFSGIMAGMMGAMTAEMLTNQQAHSILLISLLLTIVIATSCIIQFLSHTFSTFIERRFFLLLSISMLIVVGVFFMFPENHIAEVPPSHHH